MPGTRGQPSICSLGIVTAEALKGENGACPTEALSGAIVILSRHRPTLLKPRYEEKPNAAPTTAPILTASPSEFVSAVTKPPAAPTASISGMVLSTVHDPGGTGSLAGRKSGGPSTSTSEQPAERAAKAPINSIRLNTS